MSQLLGEKPPDFNISLVAGSSVNLSEIVREGKPVLITFYSLMGPGCDKLVEEVAKNVPFYEGKAKLLLINCDGLQSASTHGRKLALSSKCLHGAASVPSEYGIWYYPHRTLIGKDGQVVMNVGSRGFLGFSWADLDRAVNAETMWCILCRRPLLGTYAVDVITCKACCKSKGLPLPQRESLRRGSVGGTSVSMPDLHIAAPPNSAPPHPRENSLLNLPAMAPAQLPSRRQVGDRTGEEHGSAYQSLHRMSEARKLQRKPNKLTWRRSM